MLLAARCLVYVIFDKTVKSAGRFDLLTQERFEVDAKLAKIEFCAHLRCFLW